MTYVVAFSALTLLVGQEGRASGL